MENMKTVVNVELLRGSLVQTFEKLKRPSQVKALSSLEEMQAIYENEGVNALFVNTMMDIMPSLKKYALKFVYQNTSFTVDANEIINPVFEFVLSYDFIEAWAEGKKVFANEEYFYSNVLNRIKNAFVKMNAHNNKQLVKVERTEYRSFDDGLVMEVDVIDYHRTHVEADTRGFTSMEFDAIEMKLDIHNLLTEKERQVYKFYKEGYTVREINAMVTNGRKIRNSMMEKLEAYYLEVATDMYQVRKGIDTSFPIAQQQLQD